MQEVVQDKIDFKVKLEDQRERAEMLANYTIIQVAGLAAVQSVGNGVALVANVPAVGSAAGVIIGSAAANLYTGASLVLPQFANAAGPAVLLIPCYVNFTGQ